MVKTVPYPQGKLAITSRVLSRGCTDSRYYSGEPTEQFEIRNVGKAQASKEPSAQAIRNSRRPTVTRAAACREELNSLRRAKLA